MRYHWGLGVGHFPVHEPTSTSLDVADQPLATDEVDLSEGVITGGPEVVPAHAANHDYEIGDPEIEMSLEDHDPEGWEDVVESEGSERESNCDIDSEDDFGEIYE
jgi:hypothetical protein